jgi:hypothetical protein
LRRLSDIVAEYVRQGIEALGDEGQRDDLEWEVLPGADAQGGIAWLVGIGLPVPGTQDYQMPFAPVPDPHNADDIARLVRVLYGLVSGGDIADAAESLYGGLKQAGSPGPAAHRTSPGGLIVP